MSDSSRGSRSPMGIPGGVIALLLILGGIIGAFGACAPPLGGPSDSATATAQTQASATAQVHLNATATAQTQASATAQVHLNATATVQAQTNATATAIAIATGPPIGFSVTTLHAGDPVQANVPLTIKGTYSSEGSGHVWVVLEDNFGNYFLQNPPVKFNGAGTWTATNINPAPGITMVDFVHVTTAGHTVFLRKVAMGDFGAFNMLPADSNPFLRIPIVVS